MVYCTRAFLPLLQQAADAGEAYLVNTSSVFGLWSCPEMSSYVAAKHAVKGLTESIMTECAMKHPTLHVACVHPGGVRTEIASKSLSSPVETADARNKVVQDFNQGAGLSAEEAAAWILNGVARDSTRILVGYDAYCFDMATRLGPRWCYEAFAALGRSGWQAASLNPQDAKAPTGTQLMRTMLGGGWYMALMFSPLMLVKITQHAAFKPLAVTGAAAAAYKTWQRSKL